MRLEKEKCRNTQGYNIYLKIGKSEWQSFWSAPPITILADIDYLKDRYSCLTTKKKVETFKRLYDNLWVEVTPYQLGLMQHCIGLDYKKKPYRNYFCTQETDKDWNELVNKGLAIKGINHINNDEFIYFYLSRQGVECVLGKSVSDKVYNEL